MKGLPNAVPFKERGQRITALEDLEALVAEYLADLEARGVLDLPGGVASRGPVEALVAAGTAPGDDDALPPDDGTAEAASLAAQES